MEARRGACYVNEGWQDISLAQVVFTRHRGDGDLLFASFIVDLAARGVKDSAVLTCMSPSAFAERLATSPSPMERISFDCGARIVETGVAYAASLGIAPHPDWDLGRAIYADANPSACTLEVPCGVDGKPMFISGPNDNLDAVLGSLGFSLELEEPDVPALDAASDLDLDDLP